MGTTLIAKVAPDGTIIEYPLAMGAIPTNITVGPVGDLWFSDNSGAIGRITTGGSVQEFRRGLQSGAVPDAIAPGPDGNVWFTDQYGNRRAIGRVTPSGQITEITKGVNPTGLEDGDSVLAGPNGALWFTDSGSPKGIGRIVLPPTATTGPTTAVSATSATISGTVTPLADTTAVSIQYGTSPSLGSSTEDGSLPADTTKEPVTGTLTAFPSNTTIYYRIVATNSAGESDGTVESFKTSPPTPSAQRTTATLDNQQITLTMPADSICTASSSKLAVMLNSTAIRNSNKAKLEFSGAVLYIDKGVKRTNHEDRS